MVNNKIIEIIVKVVDNATTPINNVQKSVGQLSKGFDRARSSANRFMGIGFSMLFFAMQLKRSVDGLLNSIFNLTKIAGSETTMFNIKTQELSATWEFFKFTLIDALSNSELFIAMIDLVIKLINWFNELSDGTKLAFVGVLATLSLVFGAISMLGSVLLLVISIANVAQVPLGVVLSIMGGIVAKISILFIKAGVLFALWKSDLPLIVKIFATLLIIFGLSTIALSAFVAAQIWLGVVVIKWILKMKDEWGGFSIFFKAVMVGWMLNFAIFADFVINKTKDMLNFIINGLNKTIRAFNNTFGTSFNTIAKVTFTSDIAGNLRSNPAFADVIARAAEVDKARRLEEARKTVGTNEKEDETANAIKEGNQEINQTNQNGFGEIAAKLEEMIALAKEGQAIVPVV